MNEQQELIASLSILLIGLVIWGVYKPYLKNILFTSPKNNPSVGAYIGSLPGQLSGAGLQEISGGTVGPNGTVYGYGPNSNPWAPF